MDMIYILVGIIVFAIAFVILGALVYFGLMIYLLILDELKSRGMIKPKKKE
ncbi:MAG: hypothetical protein ACRC18_06525 [Cetobacterium sp.]